MSKRVKPSKIGILRSQAAGQRIGAEAGAGMMKAPIGSTTSCSSCAAERNAVRLVLEGRGDVDAVDRVARERHADRAGHVGVGGDCGESGRRNAAVDDRARPRSRRRARWRRVSPGQSVCRPPRSSSSLGVSFRIEVGRADRQSDQRDAIGGVQHVGARAARESDRDNGRREQTQAPPWQSRRHRLRTPHQNLIGRMNGDCAQIPARNAPKSAATARSSKKVIAPVAVKTLRRAAREP